MDLLLYYPDEKIKQFSHLPDVHSSLFLPIEHNSLSSFHTGHAHQLNPQLK